VGIASLPFLGVSSRWGHANRHYLHPPVQPRSFLTLPIHALDLLLIHHPPHGDDRHTALVSAHHLLDHWDKSKMNSRMGQFESGHSLILLVDWLGFGWIPMTDKTGRPASFDLSSQPIGASRIDDLSLV